MGNEEKKGGKGGKPQEPLNNGSGNIGRGGSEYGGRRGGGGRGSRYQNFNMNNNNDNNSGRNDNHYSSGNIGRGGSGYGGRRGGGGRGSRYQNFNMNNNNDNYSGRYDNHYSSGNIGRGGSGYGGRRGGGQPRKAWGGNADDLVLNLSNVEISSKEDVKQDEILSDTSILKGVQDTSIYSETIIKDEEYYCRNIIPGFSPDDEINIGYEGISGGGSLDFYVGFEKSTQDLNKLQDLNHLLSRDLNLFSLIMNSQIYCEENLIAESGSVLVLHCNKWRNSKFCHMHLTMDCNVIYDIEDSNDSKVSKVSITKLLRSSMKKPTIISYNNQRQDLLSKSFFQILPSNEQGKYFFLHVDDGLTFDVCGDHLGFFPLHRGTNQRYYLVYEDGTKGSNKNAMRGLLVAAEDDENYFKIGIEIANKKKKKNRYLSYDITSGTVIIVDEFKAASRWKMVEGVGKVKDNDYFVSNNYNERPEFFRPKNQYFNKDLEKAKQNLEKEVVVDTNFQITMPNAKMINGEIEFHPYLPILAFTIDEKEITDDIKLDCNLGVNRIMRHFVHNHQLDCHIVMSLKFAFGQINSVETIFSADVIGALSVNRIAIGYIFADPSQYITMISPLNKRDEWLDSYMKQGNVAPCT